MKNLDYIMISPENLEEIKQECRMEGAMKERVRINKKRQEIIEDIKFSIIFGGSCAGILLAMFLHWLVIGY